MLSCELGPFRFHPTGRDRRDPHENAQQLPSEIRSLVSAMTGSPDTMLIGRPAVSSGLWARATQFLVFFSG